MNEANPFYSRAIEDNEWERLITAISLEYTVPKLSARNLIVFLGHCESRVSELATGFYKLHRLLNSFDCGQLLGSGFLIRQYSLSTYFHKREGLRCSQIRRFFSLFNLRTFVLEKMSVLS